MAIRASVERAICNHDSALPAVPSGPALRVLVVDDSADHRALIACYLKAFAICDHAENGAIAVAKFKAARYQLVVMDVQMPVLDGHHATRQIRAFELAQGAARTPIIACTAMSWAEAATRSLAAGCDRHLGKPIARATLLAAVRQLIAA